MFFDFNVQIDIYIQIIQSQISKLMLGSDFALRQRKQSFNQLSHIDQTQKIRSKSIGSQKRKIAMDQKQNNIDKSPMSKQNNQNNINKIPIYNQKPLQEKQINQIKQNKQGSYYSSLIGWGDLSQFSLSKNEQKSCSNVDIFTKIQKKVISFSCGQNHIAFITNEGKFIYKSSSIQLKKDEHKINEFFNKQNGISKPKKVFSTPYSTFVLCQNGQTYGFGLNDRGQIGINQIGYLNHPKKITQLCSNRLKTVQSQFIIQRIGSKGKITSAYYNNQFNRLSSEQNADKAKLDQKQQILCMVGGPFHTLALTSSNRLLYSGIFYTSNNLQSDKFSSIFNQIKVPTNSLIKQIKCSLTSCGLLTVDGKLFVMGLYSDDIYFQHFTDMEINLEEKSHPTIVKQFTFLNDILYFTQHNGHLYQVNMAKRMLRINSKINQISNCSQDAKFSVLKMFSTLDYAIFIIKKTTKVGRSHTQQIKIHGIGSNQHGLIIPDNKNINQVNKIKQLKMLTKIYSENLKNIIFNCASRYIICTMQNVKEQLTTLYKKIRQVNLNNQQNRRQGVHLESKDIENILSRLKKYQQQNVLLRQQNILLKEKLSIENKNQKKRVESQPVQPVISSRLCFPIKKTHHPRTFQASLQIPFSQLKLGNKIAQGGYGIIYKGEWRKTQVAVKLFKIQVDNQMAMKDFISECYAMQAIRHPNIVMFLGACIKAPRYAIVLECCDGGTLWGLLQNHKITLEWTQRIRLALEIAKAMNYLHDREKPIVHRDLKSLNILLDQNRRVKLADFGWTKGLQNYMTSKIGTYQWMAPQVVSSQQYTQKADIFSFAIILWQIASRQPPYRNIQGMQVAYDVVNKNLRPSIPSNLPKRYQQLMINCWNKQACMRPSFKEIIDILSNQKILEGNYIN